MEFQPYFPKLSTRELYKIIRESLDETFLICLYSPSDMKALLKNSNSNGKKIMNEFLKTLLNIRSLRAVCRGLSYEQLLEAHEKLTQIIEQRKQAEMQERAQRETHMKKIQDYLDQMKEDGIDPSDLMGSFVEVEKKPGRGGKGIKRAEEPAKYEYTDAITGEQRTWTGQGHFS